MARKKTRTAKVDPRLKEIGEILLSIRKKHGESRREVAEAIGYSNTQIFQIEKGKMKPSGAYLAAFFSTYNVPASTRKQVVKLLCDYCYGEAMAA